jgi:2-polyprenyl-3-methyl-5-hydroxy-6-metoxy-1,4-benzoquinol methylase
MEAATHWREVYDTRSADEVSWYQAEPGLSLAWIREFVPDRHSRILDVGAGASLLVDRLLEEGYHRPAVLDLAPNALEVVRKRLGGRADAVEWFATDLLEFDPPHPYELWHDRAVLHFLREPSQQARYAETVRRAVLPGGLVLIATFAMGGPTRCSGLDVVQYDAPALLRLLGDEFSVVRTAEEVHRTPAGAEQRFQYTLLRRAGA